MPDDYQWQQQFHLQQEEARKRRELSSARRKDNARKTIKKYNTGKNKGMAKNTVNQAKDAMGLAMSMTTPWGVLSLLLQFNPAIDWMYGLAFFAAVLKDILNFTEATGVLYALVFIATILVSIFIGMMVLLSSVCEGKNNFAQMRMIRSLLILTLTTVVEIIPGVNFIPFEVLSVMFLYAFALQDRKKAEEAEKKAQKISATNGSYGKYAEATT